MSPVLMWSLVGIVVLIALAAILILVGLKRRKDNTISFTSKEEGDAPKKPTSGNYQAQSGFNFAAGPAKKSSEAAGGSDGDAKLVTNADELAQSGLTGASAAKEAVPAAKKSSAEAEKKAAKEAGKKTAAEAAEKKAAELAAKEAEEKAAAEAAEKKAAELAAKEAEEKAAAEEAEKEAAEQAVKEAEEKAAAEAAEREAVEKAAEQAAKEAEEKAAAEAAEKEAAEQAAKEAEEKAAKEAAEQAAKEAEEKAAKEAAEKAAREAEEKAAKEAAEKAAREAEEQAAKAAEDKAAAEAAQQAAAVEHATEVDTPDPAEGRIQRLRGRLSRSNNAIGKGVLGILGGGDLDDDAWEEIEDTLLMADVGADTTMAVVDNLRERIASQGVGSEDEARAMLRQALIDACHPEMDRSIRAMPYDGKPAVILVVGVNGTGKTTTTGKLARVLTAMGHTAVLGAADTFRAAAADQLQTWGDRVGATTVRGAEGADPAAVAFDAVDKGVELGADVVLLDTAGRLHTKVGLMDQLGKVKRVVEKKAVVDEVLLVLDATVGQNGLTQAKIFADTVDITGVVLTKLDGTAKGGIVFQVQETLGIPVKLVGLGEGADHLAPFEVEGFVDALLG